ncbi:MAG: hypothetical protein H5T86_00555 [Armatimonadetes bacterium]|nr:hypothetical protein [Armatimonadota bacterium]
MPRAGGGCAAAVMIGVAVGLCRPAVSADPGEIAARFASAIALPPQFTDRLIYYNSFDDAAGKPDWCATDISQGEVSTERGGIVGHRMAPVSRPALELRGPSLSPHLPLSVLFWWALERDPTIESCFGLLHLTNGRGFVSHFSRGRGTWCALQRPAAVLQVYYLPDVPNVNGIYDTDLAAHVELRAGVWHHTAVVIDAASRIDVYTDGRPVWSLRIGGRPLRADDRLEHLILGSQWGEKMALDEVIILRRAVGPEEIQDYYEAIRQMSRARYLSLRPTDAPKAPADTKHRVSDTGTVLEKRLGSILARRRLLG